MPIARQETGLSLSRAGTTAGGPTVWKGSCHCGRNRFEVKVPKIETAISCNCILCHKSGYLWYFPPSPFELLYRNEEGDVIALCFMKNGAARNGAPTSKLSETISNDLALLSWQKGDSDFVVVGASAEANLKQIAEDVSTAI